MPINFIQIPNSYLRNTTTFKLNGEIQPELFVRDWDYDDGTTGYVRLENNSLRVKEVAFMPNILLFAYLTDISLPTTGTISYVVDKYTLTEKPDLGDRLKLRLTTIDDFFLSIYLNVIDAESATIYTATGYFVDQSGYMYSVVYTQADANGDLKFKRIG